MHAHEATEVVFSENYLDTDQAIDGERVRQLIKFGDQTGNSNEHWLAILMEEVGEAIREHLNKEPEAFRTELVQVAAVAHAWLEAELAR